VDYEQALAWLHNLQRVGVKLGLERTQELLRRLGHPERQSGHIIHITGTSGKGSVAALVESGLRAAGARVGLYTSPSLTRFTERMQVDRAEVGPDELAALATEVATAVDAMVAEGHEQPTEFEVTTATSFLFFARHRVDWLVLEVGVGGRYDATNAIKSAAITCITNIGLDHTEWLGTTHEAIASEKAGIIKPGAPCVTGTEHLGALAVIRREAESVGTPLIEVCSDDVRVRRFGPDGQMLDMRGTQGWYWDVNLALLGPHQASNAVVALQVLELAGVPEAAIRAGFRDVVWPGRFEVIAARAGRTVVLDAAHNPAKCAALADAVQKYFPGRRVLLVLGVLADKDVSTMIRPLLDLASAVWVTTPASPRRMEASGLADVCRRLGHTVSLQPDIAAAVDEALSAVAEPSDLVLVTGSFYTVGPAREHVLIQRDKNM